MRYLLLPFTPRYILLTIALLGLLRWRRSRALTPKRSPLLPCRLLFSAL